MTSFSNVNISAKCAQNKLKFEWNKHSHCYSACSVLHSAPYRTRVSGHFGKTDSIICGAKKKKKQKQKLRVFQQNMSSVASTVLLQLGPQLNVLRNHISRSRTQWEVSSGSRNSLKYEELKARTREKESIIELSRSHQHISLHADQFSRSIQAAATTQE